MAKRKNKGAEPEAPQKLGRKTFEAELYKLHAELCRMQDWAKHTGHRAVVVFEGRDAAEGRRDQAHHRAGEPAGVPGRGPAGAERVRADPALHPALHRHMPAAGEVVLFDRSWYNRAGVERVMGFCTEEQAQAFLRVCPGFERELVHSGIQLVKYSSTSARRSRSGASATASRTRASSES